MPTSLQAFRRRSMRSVTQRRHCPEIARLMAGFLATILTLIGLVILYP